MPVQSLWIPGDPYPERRKRHFVTFFPGGVKLLAKAYARGIRGKALAPWKAKAGKVSQYPHPKTEAWRTKHVEPAIVAAGLVPIAKPHGVEIVAEFFLPRPKTHMGTGRNAGTVKPSSPAFPIGENTGDFDNLVKVVCDALKGHLWDDDSQVIRARIDKLYAAPGEPTGVRFHARPLAGKVGDLLKSAA